MAYGHYVYPELSAPQMKEVIPVRNREGETLDEAEARLLKDRVSRKHAVLYSMSLADGFEKVGDIHHAAFYRVVARLLIIHDDT